MPILNRDLILNQTTLRKELVPVPEWGGEVYIRELTAIERDNYELELSKQAAAAKGRPTYRKDPNPPAPRNIRASLVALAACDEAGAALFNADDAAQLGRQSAGVIDRLFEVASRLCGLRKSDVEELEGNSAAPSEGSPSSSV